VFFNRLLILIRFAVLLCNAIAIEAQINFSLQSEYKYLKGSEASGIPDTWMNTNYNDSQWNLGNAPFRYGDGTGGTVLSDMQNNYSTIYLRTTFNATNIDRINTITFTNDYDDGFVIWVNGSEVFRRNAPTVISNTALAPENHESGTPVTIVIDTGMIDLFEGTNAIAIQGFNVTLGSTDFYFDMKINAVPTIPEVYDTLGIMFSHPAGFYSSPFALTMTSPDNGASLLYTIDGSNPQTSSTAIHAGIQANLLINPEITTGRAKTPAFIVRASLSRNGYSPSKPETRTYIFADKVNTQTYPGGEWPTTNVNSQVIDLDMDPEVVNDSRYSASIIASLLGIPSISVVTDMAGLFDPSVGIYVNADGHGLDWERFSSVELINPDGSSGFHVNAGLRIRGGWSRHDDFPKHSFRLFFHEAYGVPKLEFPLFGDEGVSEFDKIDLRCEQNYSWANWSGEHNTMVREVFSRDSQRDMGQPYTRSRYYHLYLNGMYWGVYQTQERSEAHYASDYLGGSKEDYDVVKVNTENYAYRIEATDGVLTTWQKIYSMCGTGFADNAAFFKLEGKDRYGNPVVGSKVLVNIDNLIDYMLTIFYTGNFDAPTSSFGGNTGPNNFYAVFDRLDKRKGFVFFNHDGEHALMVDPISPGIGLYEDRVNLSMSMTDFSLFHPQWLHHKLTANPEYRMRFADRVSLHMTGNGALTPSRSLELFNKRVDEVEPAVIAESARWGDAKSSVPFTKDDTWLPEINKVRNGFFPYRTAIVLDQLKQANLYPGLDPPKLSQSGSELKDTHYNIGNSASIKIQNPNASGVVYYTMDGSDPRMIGGNISSKATKPVADYILQLNTSAMFKARVYDDGTWSAMRQINFHSSNNDYTKLKVTELDYHPPDVIEGTDTISGQDYEFIEFKNTGESALDLSGMVLDSAVYYEFPAGSLLPPGRFFVIASKPSHFYEKYGKIASGNFNGQFNNGGEYVLLRDSAHNEILSFTYDDKIPWPESADGEGYTLTAKEKNPTGDPNDYHYWMASSTIGGSPFSDDYSMVGIEPVAYESGIGHFTLYPNPSSRYIVIEADLENNKERTHISIMNLTGSVVYNAYFKGEIVIDLTTVPLTGGLYIVIISNESTAQTEKLIYAP
jgi:hypothetical protein